MTLFLKPGFGYSICLGLKVYISIRVDICVRDKISNLEPIVYSVVYHGPWRKNDFCPILMLFWEFLANTNDLNCFIRANCKQNLLAELFISTRVQPFRSIAMGLIGRPESEKGLSWLHTGYISMANEYNLLSDLFLSSSKIIFKLKY